MTFRLAMSTLDRVALSFALVLASTPFLALAASGI
jgi:hypothetical protein